MVEKINHTAAQRWWRTLADELTAEQAQTDCDRFATARGDTRLRPTTEDRRASVATVAAGEPLQPLPADPYPALLTETRVASRQALVSYRGNRYSVPPELAGATVTATRPVGGDHLDITTTSQITIVRHRLAADGAGVTVRDHDHVAALEQAAMTAAATGRPHRRKERIPPGAAARAAADTLRGEQPQLSPVIDLAAYEQAAKNRNTLS